MENKTRLVYGHGINDANFPVSRGLRMIPSYRRWVNMLNRCYSERYQRDRPNYFDCSVCEDWLRFSCFHEWYELAPKNKGDHLDKDILVPGNRIYAPHLCAFVPPGLNTFLNDTGSKRGNRLIGARQVPYGFSASCGNPFSKKNEYLGYFKTEEEAHLAWKKKKHEHACRWASRITDPRVADAIKKRFSGD